MLPLWPHPGLAHSPLRPQSSPPQPLSFPVCSPFPSNPVTGPSPCPSDLAPRSSLLREAFPLRSHDSGPSGPLEQISSLVIFLLQFLAHLPTLRLGFRHHLHPGGCPAQKQSSVRTRQTWQRTAPPISISHVLGLPQPVQAGQVRD